jgi:NTE family protein
MRVGLVLGAGGVLGGAWLVGALDALAAETGWDPGSADRIVGTSAGSMVAALLGSGVPPWFMRAHSAGEAFADLMDAEGRPAATADRSSGAVWRLHRGLPALGPGSLGLGLRTLIRPGRHTAAQLTAGWLPKGVLSTEPLKDAVRRVAPAGWSPHPGLWVVAADFATGRRVAFGRPGAPHADLADAVAASCAIPGFYRPVRIRGREYVDGGIRSVSNADLVRGLELDLALVLNPCSGAAGSAWMRREAAARVRREVRRLLDEGTEVVLVEPDGRAAAVMGTNLMARGARNAVIDVARETVAERLRSAAVAPALAGLPAGDPVAVRRPAGPPGAWATLRADVVAARVARAA